MLRHLELRGQRGSHVPTMISTLPSACMSTIIIGLVDSSVTFDSIPYASIDQALAHPRFRSLENFSMQGYSLPKYKTVSLLSEVDLRALMPMANARGILR
jgi:hypothetical protein